jgi:hypothetical protein
MYSKPTILPCLDLRVALEHLSIVSRDVERFSSLFTYLQASSEKLSQLEREKSLVQKELEEVNKEKEATARKLEEESHTVHELSLELQKKETELKSLNRDDNLSLNLLFNILQVYFCLRALLTISNSCFERVALLFVMVLASYQKFPFHQKMAFLECIELMKWYATSYFSNLFIINFGYYCISRIKKM